MGLPVAFLARILIISAKFKFAFFPFSEKNSSDQQDTDNLFFEKLFEEF